MFRDSLIAYNTKIAMDKYIFILQPWHGVNATDFPSEFSGEMSILVVTTAILFRDNEKNKGYTCK